MSRRRRDSSRTRVEQEEAKVVVVVEGSRRRRGVKRGLSEDEDDRVEKRARLYIEESLTESVVRRCPGCGAAVVKGPGCWHVACPCGEHFCFLCARPWQRCAMNCRYRSRTLARAAQRACEKLRSRYPRLTFRQCQAIIGRKWTEAGNDHKSRRRDGDGDDDDYDYDDRFATN